MIKLTVSIIVLLTLFGNTYQIEEEEVIESESGTDQFGVNLFNVTSIKGDSHYNTTEGGGGGMGINVLDDAATLHTGGSFDKNGSRGGLGANLKDVASVRSGWSSNENGTSGGFGLKLLNGLASFQTGGSVSKDGVNKNLQLTFMNKTLFSFERNGENATVNGLKFKFG